MRKDFIDFYVELYKVQLELKETEVYNLKTEIRALKTLIGEDLKEYESPLNLKGSRQYRLQEKYRRMGLCRCSAKLDGNYKTCVKCRKHARDNYYKKNPNAQPNRSYGLANECVKQGG